MGFIDIFIFSVAIIFVCFTFYRLIKHKKTGCAGCSSSCKQKKECSEKK